MQIFTYAAAWINMWTLIQAAVTPAKQDGCTSPDDMSPASSWKSLLQAPATKSAVTQMPTEPENSRIGNLNGAGVPPPSNPIAGNPSKDDTAHAPAKEVLVDKSPVAPSVESLPKDVTARAPAQEVLAETSAVAPVVERPLKEASAGALAMGPLGERNPPAPIAQSPPQEAEPQTPDGMTNALAVAAEKRETVNKMLVDLFGQPHDMEAAADYWMASGLHDTMKHLATAPKEEAQQAAALWVRLTRALVKGGKFPLKQVYRHTANSTARQSLNLWNAKVAAGLGAEGVSGIKCAETGDGHFLKAAFLGVCAETLSVDKYDPESDVKVDLSVPPAQAPKEMLPWFGTFDLLVSHQVFEHLQHPVAGMANVNAMVRPGGILFFTTPFLVQDHHDPFDYFRYTLRNVHDLLVCSGFQVKTLEGLGGYLGSISYLAGVEAEDLDPEDLTEVCDALTTDYCKDRYYSLTAAKGIKTREASYEEIRDCFG